MKSHLASTLYVAVLAPLLALLPAHAFAQQVPVTGQMLGPDASVRSSAPSAQGSTRAQLATTSPAAVNAMPATTTAAEQAQAAPTLPATAMARQPVKRAPEVGETTQSLLQMQADGSEAGKPLPMLGAEASASYARYLKSFKHDIPEFYKTTVGKDSNSGSGSE